MLIEDFVSCVLSTVATRSAIGQELGCFCPPTLISGNDHYPMQLFGLLLGGLFERNSVKGTETEACKSEYQSFEQGQRQTERTSTRSRPDVANVLIFCPSEVDFRVRHHLYKACILSKHMGSNFLVAVGSIVFCFRSFN